MATEGALTNLARENEMPTDIRIVICVILAALVVTTWTLRSISDTYQEIDKGNDVTESTARAVLTNRRLRWLWVLLLALAIPLTSFGWTWPTTLATAVVSAVGLGLLVEWAAALVTIRRAVQRGHLEPDRGATLTKKRSARLIVYLVALVIAWFVLRWWGTVGQG